MSEPFVNHTKNHRLDPAEAKGAMLRMLVAFRDFCEGHGLRYSLCGGTLLGAVRHKGYIPWDDDVDVCMPRPDYGRLLGLAEELKGASGLGLGGYCGLSPEGSPFVKLFDEAVRVKASRESEESFLWVDVIPADALPDDDSENDRVYLRMKRLRLLLMAQHSEKGMGHSPIRRLGVDVLRPLLRAAHADVRVGRKMNELAAERPWGSTEHAGCLVWGLYGPRERMPLSGLESYVDVEFEGERFKAMSCWEEYLTGLYGDYMQLPPEDKRVSHGIVAWRADGGGAE